MATEDEKRRIREFLGGKLKAYREDGSIPVTEIAKAAHVGRQYVYLVEDGTANFNINRYVDMLRACGVSFEQAIAGFKTADISETHQPYHANLSKILRNGPDELVAGIRVNLEAIAEKAVRLKQDRLRETVRQKARESPRPSRRVKQGRARGPEAGSDEKTKERRSGSN